MHTCHSQLLQRFIWLCQKFSATLKLNRDGKLAIRSLSLSYDLKMIPEEHNQNYAKTNPVPTHRSKNPSERTIQFTKPSQTLHSPHSTLHICSANTKSIRCWSCEIIRKRAVKLFHWCNQWCGRRGDIPSAIDELFLDVYIRCSFRSFTTQICQCWRMLRDHCRVLQKKKKNSPIGSTFPYSIQSPKLTLKKKKKKLQREVI